MEQDFSKFTAEDWKKYRPVMIHRTILGSMERFFGVLIEHYAGKFPLWLSPVQVAIIPISDKHGDYAQELSILLETSEIRFEVFDQNETLGKKIREAEMQKIPYLLIIGDKELENQTVSVRKRGSSSQILRSKTWAGKGDLGQMKLNEFVEKVKEEINKKFKV